MTIFDYIPGLPSRQAAGGLAGSSPRRSCDCDGGVTVHRDEVRVRGLVGVEALQPAGEW